MTVLWDWCASPSLTTHLPFRSPQANWKAECVERRPLRLEGGKDCKVLPILTTSDRSGIVDSGRRMWSCSTVGIMNVMPSCQGACPSYLAVVTGGLFYERLQGTVLRILEGCDHRY